MFNILTTPNIQLSDKMRQIALKYYLKLNKKRIVRSNRFNSDSLLVLNSRLASFIEKQDLKYYIITKESNCICINEKQLNNELDLLMN